MSMGSSRTNVLCIGAGVEQAPSIQEARALGLRVIAADGNAQAAGLRLADEAHVLDIADENAVIQVARERGVSWVVPAPLGRLLTTVGAVNDALRLPGISRRAAVRCADKAEYHRVLAGAGCVRPQQLAGRGLGELLAALRRSPAPCIVKPRYGAGKRGVRGFLTPEEVASATPQMLSAYSTDADWLIEEVVEGPEVGVDGVILGGRFVLTLVRDKVLTPWPFRQEMQYMAPAAIPGGLRDLIADQVSSAARAIGLDNCFVNADVILRAGREPVIIEMAGRPAGLRISDLIIPAVTGINILRAFMQALAGTPLLFEPSVQRAVVFSFLDTPAGRVVSVPDEATVLQDARVLRFECGMRPGDLVAPVACSSDALSRGFVMAGGATVTECRGIVDAVLRSFVVRGSETDQGAGHGNAGH